MNIDYKLLGQRIARARKKAGLTQEKLAEQASITNNYLSNIENNHSIPSLETLIKLCSALNVTPDFFLLGTNYSSAIYCHDDILLKLSACTPKEKRLVHGFIDLLLKEHH